MSRRVVIDYDTFRFNLHTTHIYKCALTVGNTNVTVNVCSECLTQVQTESEICDDIAVLRFERTIVSYCNLQTQ